MGGYIENKFILFNFRSYGRVHRILHVECEFIPFRIEDLPISSDVHFTGRPSAHVFVLENVRFFTFSSLRLVWRICTVHVYD